MNDREFLIWLHMRLEQVHEESPTMGYMHKLRAIIKATPPNQCTPNTHTENSLDDIVKKLKEIKN